MAYTIGIDYGTNSVRAVVARCSDGEIVGTSVYDYPSGEEGILLEPKDHNLARQNPVDYLTGLDASIQGALIDAEENDTQFSRDSVIGIGIDSTGSSPLPVDASNQALAEDSTWSNNLNAHCWLWKDHTSSWEAEQITKIAREHRPHFVAKCGNTYSSEWFWAKIWHCLNVDPEVFSAAYSWVELADWIPSRLAGVDRPESIVRGICAAGHKALYAEDWEGLPDAEFLTLLDPKLADLRPRLYEKAYDAGQSAGPLSPSWAETWNIPAGIPITVGEFDVHYGAIGAGITEGTLVKVIGTSTCDCAVVSADRKVEDVPGICGIVKGAILPGFYGVEAGQSAVGDIFAWFVDHLCEGDTNLHDALSAEAKALKPGASGLLSLDWNNGNRTILVDQRLTGLLLGQTLHTTRAEIYRALIEATAFGARMILERLEAYGITVERVVCAGGIAEKNPLLMQIYADVTGREMFISRSDQTCALGSAVAAAVLAGANAGGHPDFETAQSAMTGLKETHYQPDPQAREVYDALFQLYSTLHDSFGGVQQSDLGQVMKSLLDIKTQARNSS